MRRGNMRWKWFYQLRDYLKSSLWIVPLVAIPLELAAIRILQRLDSLLGWSFLGLKRNPVILKHSLHERNSWRIRLGEVAE